MNETTGWVTGFSAADNFAWLYVTHDGGDVAASSHPLTGERHPGWAIDSLQFLYQTTDGGQTWTKI